MRALLISTYDLGRQSFGLASAAAVMREAGAVVDCVDLSRDRLADDAVAAADLVAVFLPMHTATRLALPVLDRVRAANPAARLCAYGLYAPLNADLLRAHGVSCVVGGEFEDALRTLGAGGVPAETSGVPRVTFATPDRAGLPGLARYATLQVGGERRVTGYTEASRGCKHRCRHCPIVPVYNGRFRVVPVDLVLADARAQVAAGARHVTFGDPDFFNGIRHAEAVVRGLHQACPGITYDVIIKVEHLLAHRDQLPLLVETGCAFVTTAVESFDDGVLAALEKGHTQADFEAALTRARDVGLTLSPTFVAFTPWTTLASYCAFLQTIDRLGLVAQVAPIQLAIRLLVTAGSRLLELDDVRAVAGAFDGRTLTHPWTAHDPAVDALQAEVAVLVGRHSGDSREAVFDRVFRLAHARARLPIPDRQDAGVVGRAAVPYLNEPWYC